MPSPIDVHCPHCNQIIVEANYMRRLSNWQKVPRERDVFVIHRGVMVIANADFICPNCGRGVYFRVNEQKLNRLLENMSHE